MNQVFKCITEKLDVLEEIPEFFFHHFEMKKDFLTKTEKPRMMKGETESV